ncbi:hypothetical protein Q8A73_018057 [Channa argus]|nr:hypothetical protein Q8A73_018057 [Channa argus]
MNKQEHSSGSLMKETTVAPSDRWDALHPMLRRLSILTSTKLNRRFREAALRHSGDGSFTTEQMEQVVKTSRRQLLAALSPLLFDESLLFTSSRRLHNQVKGPRTSGGPPESNPAPAERRRREPEYIFTD